MNYFLYVHHMCIIIIFGYLLDIVRYGVKILYAIIFMWKLLCFPIAGSKITGGNIQICGSWFYILLG